MHGGRGGWLRARAAAAARRAGRRGAFLAFLSLLNWAYGYSLLTAPAALRRASDLLLPWTAWGILWTAMGFVTAAGIFARRDRISYGAAVTFKAAWGVLQLDLWFAHGVTLAWVGAVIWLGFAAIVLVVAGWPEPGKTVPAAPLLPGER